MSEPASAEHKPFVPPEATVRELSIKALVMGSLLGIVFAMSSVYLGLKVGLTVSASIPVAVMSITLFRWLRLRGTILENNIAQTTGSAGESLAAGVAFTLPALLLMGFDLELARIMMVALLGGLIGVLMMIPLRHGLIVKEHGKLAYPEGTACADVLVVGEKGGTEAKMVFFGFFVGFFLHAAQSIAHLWGEAASKVLTFQTVLREKAVAVKAQIAADVTPPMIGVGYIIGPKVAANMLAGGVLAFCVLMPLITMLGGDTTAAMGPGEIRGTYILYIGAGAVAAGGFISLARSIPAIVSAFRRGLGNVKLGGAGAVVARTEQDLSMKIVLGGSLAIVVAIVAAPMLDIDVLTAFLVVIFGFFFVTVSSRITGEIGSSSNPISGMTIATLLLTCGLFVLVGRTGVGFKAMALSTAALVCVAASNGGTISQDLKTGFLVGATPRHQQVAILVGVVTSAVAIGFTMLLMLKSGETYKPVAHPGVNLPLSGETAKGPDGKTYQVAFQPLDEAQHYDLDKDGKPTLVTVPFTDGAGAAIARGKYLVDEQGQPMFFVDSAIGNAYPYKLVAKAGTFPTGLATSATGELCSPNDLVAPPAPAADAPAKAPVAQAAGETRVCRTSKNADGVDVSSAVGTHQGTELGLDRQPYQSLVLTAKFGGLAAGHYLVRANNEIAFEATPIKKLDAPKPHLFALIIDGILGGKLPWGLVLIGVLISLTLELCGVRSLSMAVGLYLPISVSGGVFVGGLVRWLVDRKRRGESAAEAELSPGMLMASGLIAGGSIAGVLASGLTAAEVHESLDFSKALSWSGNETWWPLIPLGLMAGVLAYVGGWAKKKKS